MGEDGIQMFVSRRIWGLEHGRAARGEIWGRISTAVLGITAGEADNVLAFSCGRFKMVVLVLALALASVVGWPWLYPSSRPFPFLRRVIEPALVTRSLCSARGI